MADTPAVLMDLFLTCSGPENLAGVLFQRAELDNCVKPSVMTSATKITSSLGSNVLLRCDATGLPTPNLFWTKSNGSPVNNTVQESPGEGVRWSIMSLNGILYKDVGNYSCKAKNVAGNAEATISLSVAGTFSTTIPPLSPTSGPEEPSQATTLVLSTDFSDSPSVMSTVPPTTTTQPVIPVKQKTTPSNGVQRGALKPAKSQQGSNGRKLAADEKSKKNDDSKSVSDLKIVEETSDSAVLLWTADGIPNDAPLTVVYSPYGEDDIKRTVDTNAGSGKVLLEGLSPGLRYSVCLVVKGSPAGKDPCTDFYTLDIVEDDGGQDKLFMIISGIACALAVPLIALLLYKILALYCKGSNTPLDEEELGKESYVKFETISMKQKTLNSHPKELWERRQTHDSEHLLLCSRSSIDSQMTYKSDGSRSEYLC
ncbi:hypothetical protein LDENG_00006010 [Lucifuga dentata]|nr:hypothetical protein LDENG_00006010 [Lucifuga dentata]